MRSVKEYMDLPYNYIIQPIKDKSGSYYHAKVLELDGCQSTGDTFEDAYESLKEAMEFWIETKLEAGFEIPLPNVSLKEFCEFCNEIVELKLKEEIVQEEIKGKKYKYLKLIGYCSKCGEKVTTNEIIDENLRRLDETYITTEEINTIR